jgi:hypothetical protein
LSANFGVFRVSVKPQNIMFDEIQNFNIIILCQLWDHEYKEPMITVSLLEPRKLASANKSISTLSCIYGSVLGRSIMIQSFLTWCIYIYRK